MGIRLECSPLYIGFNGTKGQIVNVIDHLSLEARALRV